MREPKGSTKAHWRGFIGDRLQLMRAKVAMKAAEYAIPPYPPLVFSMPGQH